MSQKRFYNFRKECNNGVMINNKYKVSVTELMDIISDIVIDLEELDESRWKIILEEKIVDNSNVIYIDKIYIN